MPVRVKDRWVGVSVFLFLLTYVLVVYRHAIAMTFNPEDPWHFAWNADLSWRAVWSSYFNFHIDDTWYRPTAFHLQFKLLRYFLGWHDFIGLRYLNLFLYSLAAFSTYRLGVFLFRDRGVASLGALYFLSLPALYLPVYNVNSFDFVYQIYCAEAALLLWTSGAQGSPVRYAGALVLSFLAATSKEAALILPGFFFAADLFFYRPLTQVAVGDAVPFWRKRLWRTLPFFVVPALILAGKLAARSSGGGPNLAVNFDEVTTRLSFFVQWLFRLYYTGFLTSPFSGFANHLLAQLMILTFLIGGVRLAVSVWKKDGLAPALWPLGLCALWVGAFMVMPSWVGGQPWHVGLSAMGFGLMFAALGKQMLVGLPRVQWVAFVVAVLVWGTFSYRNFSDWVTKNPHGREYELNEITLNSPPVAAAEVKPGMAFLVLDSKEWGRWSYGANSLFPFLYLSHEVKQLHYPSASREELVGWLRNPRRVCLDWQPAEKIWLNKTAECERTIQARFK